MPIQRHMAANKKGSHDKACLVSAFNSLWEIAAALLKCVRFRAWVCERHLPGSRSDSTHLTAGMSAVCPDTPSKRERKLNSQSAAPLSAPVIGVTVDLTGI